MLDGGAGASFPVIFFDGESQIDLGDVVVHPSLEFKLLQGILSQRIGISPHQISIYLDCPRKSRSDRRRKIPVTPKVNFARMLGERDGFFVVVLKRLRRERRRKPNSSPEEEDAGYRPPVKAKEPQLPIQLLRRSDQNSPNLSGYYAPFYDPASPFAWEAERENYLAAMGEYDPYQRITAASDPLVCEDCWSAKQEGRAPPFHQCVYDAVTVGFRSPAGPIARPAKPSN